MWTCVAIAPVVPLAWPRISKPFLQILTLFSVKLIPPKNLQCFYFSFCNVWISYKYFSSLWEIMMEKSGRMVQSQKLSWSSIIIWNGMEDARLHNRCPSNFCVGITLPHTMVVRGKIMTIEKVLWHGMFKFSFAMPYWNITFVLEIVNFKKATTLS